MAISTVQVILNGTTHNLTLNSSTGLYEKSITSPSKSSYNLSGHYYPLTVKATDSAGNTTTLTSTDAMLGQSLRLQVKETTKPVSTITYPTESQSIANNKPTIQWTVTDDDSGVDSDTIGITIDSGSKITGGITKTAITGGYQCSYAIAESLADGTHTVYVDASDYDGNAAVQRTVNFVVDTVPPELSVTAPSNNLVTNQSEITVAGTASDKTSNPVTVKVNGKSVTVGSNGAFSTTVTLVEGANSITVVATDAVGKTSSITRIVTLDTDAPIINSVEISPNPVSTGDIITVTVDVTE